MYETRGTIPSTEGGDPTLRRRGARYFISSSSRYTNLFVRPEA
jgi:hypothetical protein